ncbi:hypothetical protein DND132_0969 [Pseudodesulfovibrio mercurii]|uniref:Osmotically inducible protein OsmC n=1 Tax=Pseudodesulfovibrio mercurii TaxID=641491 RepID=F0JID0_9BACT|nr:hypothetical protein [Pseudodesulfovibrio mercurii]EGB14182.1 hypothetical protein DND132_0969 [Pseudodesulfovibrio mercurii]
MPEVTFARNVATGKDTYKLGSCFSEEFVFDLNSVSVEERNQDHTGARLLCAAALACFCNTFYNELVNSGAEVKFIHASANTEKEQDLTMRTHYCAMSIELEAGMNEKYMHIFDEVAEHMLNGSLLTYSLEEAMSIDYNFKLTFVD